MKRNINSLITSFMDDPGNHGRKTNKTLCHRQRRDTAMNAFVLQDKRERKNALMMTNIISGLGQQRAHSTLFGDSGLLLIMTGLLLLLYFISG